MSADARPVPQTERDWWLRVLLVLGSPRPVFAALRDDSDAAAAARQEPVGMVVLLAGVGVALMSTEAGRLMNDPEYDALLIAIWAVIAGTICGVAFYFAVGALVLLGGRLAGSAGSYRRARHVLGFASLPLVASLAVVPVRVAVYGEDAFRSGGADSGSGGNALLEALELGFLVWAVALLAIGIRTVHGWTWLRALAATAVPALAPALALARTYGLV